MATPKEIQKQLEKIQKLYNQLGKTNPFAGADADAISKSTKEVQKLGDALEGVQSKVDNLDQTFSDLQTQLRNTINEIKKGPDATARLAKGFKGVLAEVKKLAYEEEGLDRLSIDQLKNLKKRASQRQSDASAAAKELVNEYKLGRDILGSTKEKLEYYKRQPDAVKAALGYLNNEDETMSSINKKVNERIAFEEQVNKNLGLGGNLIKGVGGALEKLGMGGLAKQLGLDEAQKKMREVSEEIENSDSGLSAMQKKRKVLSAGFNSMGKSLIKNLKDPLSIGLFLFNGLFDAIKAVDKQSGELAKGLNMSYNEAAALSSELSSAANMSGELKLTAAGLGEALLAVNNITGVYTTENSKNLETFQMLHKTAGLTYEQMGGIYSVTQATGGDLEKNTEEVLAQSTLTAQSYGVQINSKKVLADIGKISKATTLSLGGSAAELSKALTTSQALGISMSQMESIADGLLNFEQSISNEMEAEMLTGKSLNLEKARSLALNNDIAGAAAEIAKQVGTAADFGKMNRIQQEALAKATGLSKEELANSLFVQEQLANSVGKEYEEKKKIIDELQAKGLSQEEIKKKLGKESLADLKAQSSVQENINDSIAKMKELFVSIAAPLMQVITPIIELLVPAIQLMGILLLPLTEGFKVIGDSVSGIFGFITGTTEELGVMQAIIGTIVVAYGAFYTISKGIQITTGIIKGIQAASLGIQGKRNLLESKGLAKVVGTAIFSAISSFSKIPFGVGVGLGLIAAAGITAMAAKYMTGDDVMSPGENTSGYGNRTLFGPEGAIALNNKDTVIAGTNLFKGNDVMSGPAGSMQMPDNSEAKKTNELLRAVLSQPKPQPIITMNDVALGTAVDMGAFSIQ
mgnify:FL=1|tara:strand:- start:1214 stop:3802 length:2589 start_codon:yes stop_codon:yes gene_type:complete